jgi:hypothetical protein
MLFMITTKRNAYIFVLYVQHGMTPLHVASHYDHVKVALLLLNKDASKYATTKVRGVKYSLFIFPIYNTRYNTNANVVNSVLNIHQIYDADVAKNCRYRHSFASRVKSMDGCW